MLTIELLKNRLSESSQKYKTRWPKLAGSPIALYQELFSLAHDLKGSAHLSTDGGVVKTLNTILNIDALLRRLAYDEVELDQITNQKLHTLAQDLNDIELVENFLKKAMQSAQLNPNTTPKVCSLSYSWEAMSRARARSCERHGFSFYERKGQTLLNSLNAHEARLQEELRDHSAILIARKVDPVIDAKTSSTEFLLSVSDLAGFLEAPQLASGWSKV
ncbi:MAG: hypothetical protein AB1540_06935 [Bdellovibrionota bacterium]